MHEQYVEDVKLAILELNKKKAVFFNLKYINRLSDFLFVVARKINLIKNQELLWKPGKLKFKFSI